MKLKGDEIDRAAIIVAEMMEKNDVGKYIEAHVRDQKSVEALGEEMARRAGYEPMSDKEFLDVFFPTGGKARGAARTAAREKIRRLKKGGDAEHSNPRAKVLNAVMYNVTHLNRIPELASLGYDEGSNLYKVASNTLHEITEEWLARTRESFRKMEDPREILELLRRAVSSLKRVGRDYADNMAARLDPLVSEFETTVEEDTNG